MGKPLRHVVIAFMADDAPAAPEAPPTRRSRAGITALFGMVTAVLVAGALLAVRYLATHPAPGFASPF